MPGAGAILVHPIPWAITPLTFTPTPAVTRPPRRQFTEYVAPLRTYLAKYREAEAAAGKNKDGVTG